MLHLRMGQLVCNPHGFTVTEAQGVLVHSWNWSDNPGWNEQHITTYLAPGRWYYAIHTIPLGTYVFDWVNLV